MIETGWGLNICTRCGVSIRVSISNVVNHAVPCSTRPPYSKHKRFAKLLCHTYGHRVSKISPLLIDAITSAKACTPGCVYRLIRASRGAHMKRYDAIAHLSSSLFDIRIVPILHRQSDWADYTFREVVSMHARIRGTFPAYSWCIEKCLIALDRQDLLVFVHRLKCKKRRLVYEHNYGYLFKLQSGGCGTPIQQHL